MLFITNRFPTQSIKTRVGRGFDFDLKNNAASDSVFYCRRLDTAKYEEIGGFNLMSELKASPYRQLLVYIHGFSNLPEAVFEGAAQLQALCDAQKKNELLVLPVVWPCDDDLGVVQDYWDDQKAADASAFSLARVLAHFITWREDTQRNPQDDPCLKRINVLAHSMGNRVLRATLDNWAHYDMPNGVPLLFRNTYLVAADIENESIHYVVDCDDVNTTYDPPIGHSYFRFDGGGAGGGRPGKVFEHIWQTIMTGRVFPDDESRRTSIIRG
jgi:hypothetical protein